MGGLGSWNIECGWSVIIDEIFHRSIHFTCLKMTQLLPLVFLLKPFMSKLICWNTQSFCCLKHFRVHKTPVRVFLIKKTRDLGSHSIQLHTITYTLPSWTFQIQPTDNLTSPINSAPCYPIQLHPYLPRPLHNSIHTYNHCLCVWRWRRLVAPILVSALWWSIFWGRRRSSCLKIVIYISGMRRRRLRASIMRTAAFRRRGRRSSLLELFIYISGMRRWRAIAARSVLGLITLRRWWWCCQGFFKRELGQVRCWERSG